MPKDSMLPFNLAPEPLTIAPCVTAVLARAARGGRLRIILGGVQAGAGAVLPHRLADPLGLGTAGRVNPTSFRIPRSARSEPSPLSTTATLP